MDANKLIMLLDDPQVQKKIISLLGSVDCEKTDKKEHITYLLDLDKENQSLKRDLESIKQTNQVLKSELESEQKTNQTLEKEKNEMASLIGKLKNLILGKDKELSDSDSQLSCLQKSSDTLQTNLINEKQLLSHAEEKFNLLQQEFKKVTAELADTNKRVDWYRDQFSEDIKLQETYSHLSDDTKSSLSGIFKSTTPKGLIACGVQEKNIGNLWEYAKNEVVKGSNPDISTITKLFEILFSRFTLAFPMYEPQRVEAGEDFDLQLHIKHNTSHHVNGVIDAVLLRGYLNQKTGKVIKQSVVKL